jgi:sucrose-6-phosphate hydrolase SacC (GH32 family)
MAVFDETGTLEIKWGPRYIQFYSSTNMKDWTYQGHLLGYFECPELFELPVDGGTNGTKWVIFGANSEYQIGEFDGRTFTPDHTDKYRVHYGKYYAAQTFDNTPDGRRIQMGWVKISSPGPYNQHFSFPHCNTLRTTKDGIRMFAEPIEEISKLRKKTDTLSAQLLPDGVSRSLSVSGKLFDIRATFKVGNADKVAISMDGATIIYDAKSRTLNDNPLEPVDGKISIQALIDNSIMEIVGNDGRIFITEPHTYQGTVNEIKITANGGDADLIKFEAHELNSIWGN